MIRIFLENSYFYVPAPSTTILSDCEGNNQKSDTIFRIAFCRKYFLNLLKTSLIRDVKQFF